MFFFFKGMVTKILAKQNVLQWKYKQCSLVDKHRNADTVSKLLTSYFAICVKTVYVTYWVIYIPIQIHLHSDRQLYRSGQLISLALLQGINTTRCVEGSGPNLGSLWTTETIQVWFLGKMASNETTSKRKRIFLSLTGQMTSTLCSWLWWGVTALLTAAKGTFTTIRTLRLLYMISQDISSISNTQSCFSLCMAWNWSCVFFAG